MNTKFLFSALFTTSVAFAASAQASLPDIVATSCPGCTDTQFESAAIGLGIGQHYLYDFSGRKFRNYQVIRENEPGVGIMWFVQELDADAAYASYFQQSLDYRDEFGSFSKAVTINLQDAPNTGGRANDSVFSVYGSAEAGNAFGMWLSEYFNTEGIPVAYPEAAERLDALIQFKPGITYTDPDDLTRLSVTIVFKDGEVEYELTPGQTRYKRVANSGVTDEGHPIPDSPSQIPAGQQFGFPGGPSSASYQAFLALMASYGIPINVPGGGSWVCGTVDNDPQTTTCRLTR